MTDETNDTTDDAPTKPEQGAPAEAEELLAWMSKNKDAWRA